MALYNELLTSLLNSHSWLYRNCLRIIDLIMDRQSCSDVSTKGPCLDAMVLNYLRSIGMQKQMTVIGERLFDWIVSNLIWVPRRRGSVIKELNVFLKDCFKIRYPSLLSLQSKIARTHPIKPKQRITREKPWHRNWLYNS